VAISFQYALLVLSSQTDLEAGAHPPDPVLAAVHASMRRMVTFSESFCVIFSRGSKSLALYLPVALAARCKGRGGPD
jgi:hypothetical protein